MNGAWRQKTCGRQYLPAQSAPHLVFCVLTLAHKQIMGANKAPLTRRIELGGRSSRCRRPYSRTNWLPLSSILPHCFRTCERVHTHAYSCVQTQTLIPCTAFASSSKKHRCKRKRRQERHSGERRDMPEVAQERSSKQPPRAHDCCPAAPHSPQTP